MIGGGKGKFMIKWILFLMENFYTYHRHTHTHYFFNFYGYDDFKGDKKRGGEVMKYNKMILILP